MCRRSRRMEIEWGKKTLSNKAIYSNEERVKMYDTRTFDTEKNTNWRRKKKNHFESKIKNFDPARLNFAFLGPKFPSAKKLLLQNNIRTCERKNRINSICVFGLLFLSSTPLFGIAFFVIAFDKNSVIISLGFRLFFLLLLVRLLMFLVLIVGWDLLLLCAYHSDAISVAIFFFFHFSCKN